MRKADKKEPILGAGAGIGPVAKAYEVEGNFIIFYNSGRYRMAGIGSLAGLMLYKGTHEILLDLSCNYRDGKS